MGELFLATELQVGVGRIFTTARNNVQSDWCVFATSGENVPKKYHSMSGVIQASFVSITISLVALVVIFTVVSLIGACKKSTLFGKLM